VALAHVIDPTLLGTELRGVIVDTGPELSRGRTHADLSGRSGLPRNCHVALSIDSERFLELLVGRIAALG
jgi:inosine-uridine nucleoside N-ribohydrolase